MERLGALDRRELFAVTLTAADGFDVTSAAGAFAEHMAGAAGVVLVPERSRAGRLHYHGLVIAPSRGVVEALWGWCASGRAEITPIRPGDFARLRHVAAYAMKGPAAGLEIISSGVLARWRETAPPSDTDARRASVEAPAVRETMAEPCEIHTGVAVEDVVVSTAGAPARPIHAVAEPDRRRLWGVLSAVPSTLRSGAEWLARQGRCVARRAGRAWRDWFGP